MDEKDKAARRLQAALHGISPKSFDSEPVKKARLDIRVSDAERREIETTAKKLDLSITDYILQLHRIASAKLRD